MTLGATQIELIQRLSAEADQASEEPYHTFGDAELQDAYYELRAKACGYESLESIPDPEIPSELQAELDARERKLDEGRAWALKVFGL
jgi:hypothetical protein